MKAFFRILWGVTFVLLGLPVVAEDDHCGGEVACRVEGGEYFIHLPEGVPATARKGAVFFLHGHRGAAINEIRQKAFLRLADDLDVAFVAVQGLEGTWSFPSAPRHLRNEFGFFDRVLDDAAARFGVDRDRTLLSGFSSGAFMTWYLACDDARRFSGYAPIAGAFWKPLPEKCLTDPPYLFHVHGTADTVVSLAGRALGNGRWHQGDVFQSFDIWLRQARLASAAPETSTADGLRCERWTPQGGLLELCLHDGGHSVRAEWIRRAWHELAKARGWQDVVAPAVHARCREPDDKLTEEEKTRAC